MFSFEMFFFYFSGVYVAIYFLIIFKKKNRIECYLTLVMLVFKLVSHFIKQDSIGSRGVFRSQSNIYDEAFLQKLITDYYSQFVGMNKWKIVWNKRKEILVKTFVC